MRKTITLAGTLLVLATLTLTACGSTSATQSDNTSKVSQASTSPQKTTTLESGTQKNENKAATSSSRKKLPLEYRLALKKAQSYSDVMKASKKRIYHMLTLKTSYGDAIDSKLAQYAVNHIKVDWNQNALAKAKDYQQIQNLSESRLKMQLTAKAGDQFTEEQANYAIQHLND